MAVTNDDNNSQVEHVARVEIERSKTNKESIKLEELYLPKIKRIFKQIVKEYAGKNFYFLHEAEKKYGTEIKTLIKSMVTRSYLLGIDYVSRATNKPQYMYLSHNDVSRIMLQSDESYRAFWRLITKYLQVLKNRQVTVTKRVGQVYRHKPDQSKDVMLTDEMMNVSDWEDDRLLDVDTNTGLIINGVVITTLALATLEKFKEYKTDEQIIKTNVDEETIEEIELTEGGGGGGGEEEGDTVIFATEKDDRVCPTCQFLEGTEWSIDDPSIVMPPDDLHPNCRCRLLLKINNKIMNK